jgi:hypothetical protein
MLVYNKNIPLSIIRELRNDADPSQWKQIIEIIPLLNNIVISVKTENIVKSLKSELQCIGGNEHIVGNDKYIGIPLPAANREWTLSAFEIINEIITKYPKSFPIHGLYAEKAAGSLGVEENKYLFIDIIDVCKIDQEGEINITITEQNIKKLYSISCSKWKKILNQYFPTKQNIGLEKKKGDVKFETSDIQVGYGCVPEELRGRCLVVGNNIKVIVEDNPNMFFSKRIRFVKNNEN